MASFTKPPGKSGYRTPLPNYYRRFMQVPMLTHEEEKALFKAWEETRNEACKRRIIESHMRLVISMATKYRRFGLSFEDTVSEGSVGLSKAFAEFELARGVRFSTYASWWIKSYIFEYAYKNHSLVRIPNTAGTRKLFFKLGPAASQIGADGKYLTSEQSEKLAKILNMPVEDIEMMWIRLKGSSSSLDQPVHFDSDTKLGDTLTDPDAVDPETATIARQMLEMRTAWVRQWAENNLGGRDRDIFTSRILTDEPVTLETLGAKLGISKERVRQVETRLLERFVNDVRKHAKQLGFDPRQAQLVKSMTKRGRQAGASMSTV